MPYEISGPELESCDVPAPQSEDSRLVLLIICARRAGYETITLHVRFRVVHSASHSFSLTVSTGVVTIDFHLLACTAGLTSDLTCLKYPVSILVVIETIQYIPVASLKKRAFSGYRNHS